MLTVLILDDSDADTYFLGRILKGMVPDCSVHAFNYPDDALDFLKSPNRPNLDLVFADINMPRMNGFEFADAYAELYPELRGKAPVYIVSSSLDPQDEAKANQHRALAGFLEKPITRENLAKILPS